MEADKSTYDFIRSAAIEGEKLKAYWDRKIKLPSGKWVDDYTDKRGKWTIGAGLCFYPNGKAVKQGDTITQAQSETMFYERAKEFTKDVNNCLEREISRKHWNVLFSVAWNYGTGWFDKERLIVKQFNKNPNDFIEIKRILNLMDNKNRRMNEFNYLTK